MIERLSDARPGVELGALLASIDRSTLDGPGLVEVLRAQARQVAHEQARLLADLVAVADFDDPTTPAELTGIAFDCAAVEVAAALTWTRRAAQDWLAVAREVVRERPALHAALVAGELDLPKVRVFCDELTGADDSAAARVLGVVLPEAPGWTTGQLRARLRKLLAAADPRQAKARYEHGVAGRRVGCYAGPDGTATLAGWQLPAERAAAATERLDALAKAAKCAGDHRTMDQLRADAFLGLLNGDYAGPAPVHRRGVVELTVPLTTLLGLADAPGELAGYGPIVADVARQVADRQRHSSTWRYSVLDTTGRLLHHGITRRRPTAPDAASVRARYRRCVFPGCRVPASRCDLDHRQRHTDGGVSTPDNLAPLCRHHHRAKDEAGWRLLHLGADLHQWISPMGQTYLVRPESLEPP